LTVLLKRIIFTLLYDDGAFVLSRNFKLQKVGDLTWLNINYNFSSVAYHIDELVVLDVTRKNRNIDRFCQALSELSRQVFIPIAAGGGITSLTDAQKLLRSGADKLVINSALFEQPSLVKKLADQFGQQCIVGSVDFSKQLNSEYKVYIKNGSTVVNDYKETITNLINEKMLGEVYLNSIDQDGTGNGYDFGLLNIFPELTVPIVIAGGVGNAKHFEAGLKNQKINAVATAHLFNFIGDGLKQSRDYLKERGFELASWEVPPSNQNSNYNA